MIDKLRLEATRVYKAITSMRDELPDLQQRSFEDAVLTFLAVDIAQAIEPNVWPTLSLTFAQQGLTTQADWVRLLDALGADFRLSSELEHSPVELPLSVVRHAYELASGASTGLQKAGAPRTYLFDFVYARAIAEQTTRAPELPGVEFHPKLSPFLG